MKVLLINGSPHEAGCTYTALSEVAKTLNAEEIETQIFQIGKAPVRGCIACNACSKLGKCVFDDDPANEMLKLMREADGIVVGSPVYYAGPNGALCALLDRAFYASGGFPFKPAAAVVSARRSGTTGGFVVSLRTINGKNLQIILRRKIGARTARPRRPELRYGKPCGP